jgi:hypothetical protein
MRWIYAGHATGVFLGADSIWDSDPIGTLPDGRVVLMCSVLAPVLRMNTSHTETGKQWRRTLKILYGKIAAHISLKNLTHNSGTGFAKSNKERPALPLDTEKQVRANFDYNL